MSSINTYEIDPKYDTRSYLMQCLHILMTETRYINTLGLGNSKIAQTLNDHDTNDKFWKSTETMIDVIEDADKEMESWAPEGYEWTRNDEWAEYTPTTKLHPFIYINGKLLEFQCGAKVIMAHNEKEAREMLNIKSAFLKN